MSKSYSKGQTVFAVIVGLILAVILVVSLVFGGDLNSDTSDGSSLISVSGTHELAGEYQCITVNTLNDVRLILNNAVITCDTGPAIYIEKSGDVEIVLKGENKITVKTTEDFEGAIHSKEDLLMSGDGSLEISSNFDGIVGRDSVVIEGGTYIINSDADGVKAKDDLTINGGTFTIKCNDDGVRAKGKVEIDGGKFDITAREGFEGTYLVFNGGEIEITASDDGMNAGSKSDAYAVAIEINGGAITIEMGAGDTDAIDSNGDLVISGGMINITAQSPFDYEGTATYTGGTLIVNGEIVDEITNQFGDGGPGGMGQPSGDSGQPSEMGPGSMGPGQGGMPGRM